MLEGSSLNSSSPSSLIHIHLVIIARPTKVLKIMACWSGHRSEAGLIFPTSTKMDLPARTDVDSIPTTTVSDTVLKSTELGAEAKGSLVLELEDLTLETQDAKPVVVSDFSLSLRTCNLCSYKVMLLEGGMNVPIYRRKEQHAFQQL
ncbi:hypothetical protein Tco_0915315 [Tanacetum coccineum]